MAQHVKLKPDVNGMYSWVNAWDGSTVELPNGTILPGHPAPEGAGGYINYWNAAKEIKLQEQEKGK